MTCFRALPIACCLVLPLSTLACGGDDSSGKKSGGTTDGGADAQNWPAVDFSEFDATINQFLTDNGLKGASAVIVQKDWGIVHTQGYGDFAKDRLYLVASSSKVLSVGVLMRLADQGKLDVDAPIGTYLSSWGAGKDYLEVAQLVSNSSGLVGLIDNPLYGPYLCQYIDSSALSACAKTIYTAADEGDRKPPDTEFHYGGGQWQLAGGIAEQVGGKSWADLVKETYVDNCGTPSLGYTNQFTKAYLGAGGTDAGGSVGNALSYPVFFSGDPADLPQSQNPSIEGGAYTTAEDYGKILLMHLRGGKCDQNQVLSEAAVKRMQEDRIWEKYQGETIGGGALKGYGMGWWIDRDNPGFFADPGAYGAIPWLDLNREYGAFVALESDAGVGALLLTALKPVADAAFDAVAGSH